MHKPKVNTKPRTRAPLPFPLLHVLHFVPLPSTLAHVCVCVWQVARRMITEHRAKGKLSTIFLLFYRS